MRSIESGGYDAQLQNTSCRLQIINRRLGIISIYIKCIKRPWIGGRLHVYRYHTHMRITQGNEKDLPCPIGIAEEVLMYSPGDYFVSIFFLKKFRFLRRFRISVWPSVTCSNVTLHISFTDGRSITLLSGRG